MEGMEWNVSCVRARGIVVTNTMNQWSMVNGSMVNGHEGMIKSLMWDASSAPSAPSAPPSKNPPFQQIFPRQGPPPLYFSTWAKRRRREKPRKLSQTTLYIHPFLYTRKILVIQMNNNLLECKKCHPNKNRKSCHHLSHAMQSTEHLTPNVNPKKKKNLSSETPAIPFHIQYLAHLSVPRSLLPTS